MIFLQISLSFLVFASISNTSIMKEANAFFHDQKSSQNFIAYENPQLKFTIKYPSNWQEEERLGGFVTFTAPLENPSQVRYPAGVGISSKALDSNISLNTIQNVNIKNLTNSLKDFQLLDSSSIILPGSYPAMQTIFTAIDGEEKRKALQIIVKSQDHAYLLTYKAEIDKYEKYLPIFQKMVETFTLIK